MRCTCQSPLRRMLWAAACLTVGVSAVWAAPEAGGAKDEHLTATRRFVDASDRYLHHSRLRRGMKGYGLTVMAGTEIVRFDVEVVSVMTQWGPHQDVILAKLSKHNLEKTGIIAGMSGSPCFIADPRDGKPKMIGAVAYGWSAQKEPLCGIQPITQMLAIGKVLSKATGKPAPGKVGKADKTGKDVASGPASAAYLAAVLNPKKVDFSQFGWPKRLTQPARAASDAPRLTRLATPMMVSGMGRQAMDELASRLGPAGIIPVQAGGVGAADAAAAKGVKLEPGSAIAIPLATGDADMSATGTVTEVIGDQVLAFGHSFYAEGDISYPMGPAYVHTVVSGLMRSFKLSSSLGVTGELTRDEETAVGGVIGRKVKMIPMAVTVHWKKDDRKQTFNYEVAWDRYFTPSLVGSLVSSSISGWRGLPEFNTVRYTAHVDFEKLGRYTASNIDSDGSTYSIASDVVRPISAILRNPWTKPNRVTGISVAVTVESKQITADLLELKLDGPVYHPGETVTGQVTIRPFRQERTTLPVSLTLPADLPEGTHRLEVGNYMFALSRLQSEMPHRFRPRSVPELFRSIQLVVEPQADHLYVRLALPSGGLALHRRELPDLPASKALVLAEARKIDTTSFRRSLARATKTPYVLSGSVAASFTVKKKPSETLIREQRK